MCCTLLTSILLSNSAMHLEGKVLMPFVFHTVMSAILKVFKSLSVSCILIFKAFMLVLEVNLTARRE